MTWKEQEVIDNEDDTSGLDTDTYTRYDNNIGLMNSQEVEDFLNELYGVDLDDTSLDDNYTGNESIEIPTDLGGAPGLIQSLLKIKDKHNS